MRRRHKLRVQWFWWLFKWLFDIRRRVIWSDVSTRHGRKLFFKAGGGERGVSLNIIIMWGGVEINFCLMRGGYDLVLGHISPISQFPPPGNYYTVPRSRYGPANRAGSLFKQAFSYHWQAHIQKLHNRVKCSREYSTSAAFETKLGLKLRFSALKHIGTTVSVTR